MDKVDHTLYRAGAILLAAVMFLCCMPVSALAESNSQSLRIVYVDEGMPIPDTTFKLYRAANIHGVLTDEFAPTNLSFVPKPTNAEWIAAAETLAAYANENGLTPMQTGATNANGVLVFSGLETGLYLVVGSKTDYDGKMYTAQTFIARVDGDVTVEPKFTFGKIPTLDSYAYGGDVEPDMSSRTKWVMEDPDATITDEVYLGGLEVGEEYELRSVILNDTYDFGFPVPALFNGHSMSDNYGGTLGTLAEELVMDVFEAWGIPYPTEPSATVALASLAGAPPMPINAHEIPEDIPKWHPDGMWFDLPAAIDEEKVQALLANPKYAEILNVIAFKHESFVATEEIMTVSTVFEHLNTVNKSGQDLRVFQILSKDHAIIATEIVAQYERETVHVGAPEIDTVATIDDGHVAVADGSVTLTDVVSYTGLTPGKEYRLEGILMDPATGETFRASDRKDITAQTTFVPETESGTVEQTFTFTAWGLGGRSAVVYETLYREGYEMAAHADLKDEEQTVSFLSPPPPDNPPLGNLSVTKEVTGQGDTQREWHFTVTLDPRRSGTYGGHTFKNGVCDFTLRSGETVTFTGLPTGTRYTVTETEAGQDGYNTTTRNASGSIPRDATVAATFTNSLSAQTPRGDLTVEKRVEGIGDLARQWHFTVTLDPKLNGTYGDMTFVDGVCQVTLKSGETQTATGLPVGTRYTVTEREANQDGYVTTDMGATGAVTETGARAVFVNRLAPTVPEEGTGSLKVTKQVTGQGDTQREWHFTVTLSDPSLNGVYGDMTFTNGMASFTLKSGESRTAAGLPAGVQYTVTESEANQEGYATTATGATGSIQNGATSGAEFINHKPDSSDTPSNPSEPGNPNDPGNPGDSNNPGNPGKPNDTPKTGDDSHLGAWIALMVLSFIGAALTVWYLVNNRRHERATDRRR